VWGVVLLLVCAALPEALLHGWLVFFYHPDESIVLTLSRNPLLPAPLMLLFRGVFDSSDRLLLCDAV
jgi:hypothetical protein